MKKHLITLLAVAVLFIAGIAGASDTAYAGQRCNLQFIITDETSAEEGYPGSEILAVMTDREKGISDKYLLTYADTWGHGETPYYTVEAPAQYEVTFEGVEDGYRVVDSSDPEKDIVIKVEPGNEIECRWSIVELEESEETGERTESPETETWEKTGNRETMPEDAFGIDREEADKVYQEFLEAVAFTENDDDWNDDVFVQYEWFDAMYAERYAKYVKGGSEEEFLSMSLYERFLWSESYLSFAWAVNSTSYDTYYGSEEKFKSGITDDITNLIEDEPGYKKVEKAYLKLAKWQYDCVHKTGVPYNFINKKSYIEETTDNLLPRPDLEDLEENTKTEDEELKEAAEELLEDSDESLESVKDAFEDEGDTETGSILDEKNEDYKPFAAEGKKGIWDRVIDSAQKNIIPIVIMIVLCVVLTVVILKRKRLNIDDVFREEYKNSGSSVDSTKDE